jgi:hypothetical protein
MHHLAGNLDHSQHGENIFPKETPILADNKGTPPFIRMAQAGVSML